MFHALVEVSVIRFMHTWLRMIPRVTLYKRHIIPSIVNCHVIINSTDLTSSSDTCLQPCQLHATTRWLPCQHPYYVSTNRWPLSPQPLTAIDHHSDVVPQHWLEMSYFSMDHVITPPHVYHSIPASPPLTIILHLWPSFTGLFGHRFLPGKYSILPLRFLLIF